MTRKPRLQRTILPAHLNLVAGIFLLLSVFWSVSTKHRAYTAIVLEQPPLAKYYTPPLRIEASPTLDLLIDSVGKAHTYYYYGAAENISLTVLDLNVPREVAKLKARLARIKREGGQETNGANSRWALRVKICPHEQARYKHVITLLDLLHQENITRHKIGVFQAHHAYFLRTGKRMDDILESYNDIKIQTIKFIPPEPITE